MDIRRLAQNAAKAQHIVAVTRKHRPSFTENAKECALIRKLYPNYKALQKAFPHLSYWALRYRTGVLGLTPKRLAWKANEISRLRRLFPILPSKELSAHFPGYSWERIQHKANRLGLHKKKLKLKPSGYEIIDIIRERARSLNLTMMDLDEMANTKCYFQNHGWTNATNYSPARIDRAVRALDGSLTVKWND